MEGGRGPAGRSAAAAGGASCPQMWRRPQKSSSGAAAWPAGPGRPRHRQAARGAGRVPQKPHRSPQRPQLILGVGGPGAAGLDQPHPPRGRGARHMWAHPTCPLPTPDSSRDVQERPDSCGRGSKFAWWPPGARAPEGSIWAHPNVPGLKSWTPRARLTSKQHTVNTPQCLHAHTRTRSHADKPTWWHANPCRELPCTSGCSQQPRGPRGRVVRPSWDFGA